LLALSLKNWTLFYLYIITRVYINLSDGTSGERSEFPSEAMTSINGQKRIGMQWRVAWPRMLVRGARRWVGHNTCQSITDENIGVNAGAGRQCSVIVFEGGGHSLRSSPKCQKK
jgi:hypothetical protein